MEELYKRTTYPCRDVPTACGWGVTPDYACVHPFCWWGGRFLEKMFQEIEKGQTFTAIVYHGDNPVIADALLKYLKGRRDEEKIIQLDGFPCDIQVRSAKIRNLEGTYEVKLEGIFV